MSLKNRTRRRLFSGFGGVYCALVFALLYLPIAVVVINSFNGTTEKPYLTWEGFSLRWYGALFDNDALLRSFGNTMVLALTTMVVATVIGTIAAVGLYRYKFRGRNLIDGLLYIPVVIPEIVMGVSLLMLYVKTGIPRGMVGLVIAHVTFCVSFVIFNVRARLGGYDSSLEEASMDLGAGRLKTFFNVTLPMLMPGIAGGALLSFTLSIDDVVVSYFVYGVDATFPLQVMTSIKGGVRPDVNALSTLVLLGTILLVVLTQSDIVRKVRARHRERRRAATLAAYVAAGEVDAAEAARLVDPEDLVELEGIEGIEQIEEAAREAEAREEGDELEDDVTYTGESTGAPRDDAGTAVGRDDREVL